MKKLNIITANKLAKSFRGGVKAVDGLDLAVEKGEIFGFLGPNGAGKTTTLRMLATLLPIDSGEASISGYDVRLQSKQVRQKLGYVGQLGGADKGGMATAREDLILQGRLYGISTAEAGNRAAELINSLDLAEFADRRVITYSGGQKRRLEVALGIMHRPEVLFLDEPTTGLDPQNRANLWVQIQKLRDAGTTVFLTTHYLEEADVLCDRVAIIDHGKIVALGAPKALKQEVAGDSVVFSFKNDGASISEAASLFRPQPYVREVQADAHVLRLYVDEAPTCLPRMLRLLDEAKLGVMTATISEPTLDDVFFHKTGRSLRDTAAANNGDNR